MYNTSIETHSLVFNKYLVIGEVIVRIFNMVVVERSRLQKKTGHYQHTPPNQFNTTSSILKDLKPSAEISAEDRRLTR